MGFTSTLSFQANHNGRLPVRPLWVQGRARGQNAENTILPDCISGCMPAHQPISGRQFVVGLYQEDQHEQHGGVEMKRRLLAVPDLGSHMANHSPPTTMNPMNQLAKPIVAAITPNDLAR